VGVCVIDIFVVWVMCVYTGGCGGEGSVTYDRSLIMQMKALIGGGRVKRAFVCLP